MSLLYDALIISGNAEMPRGFLAYFPSQPRTNILEKLLEKIEINYGHEFLEHDTGKKVFDAILNSGHFTGKLDVEEHFPYIIEKIGYDEFIGKLDTDYSMEMFLKDEIKRQGPSFIVKLDELNLSDKALDRLAYTIADLISANWKYETLFKENLSPRFEHFLLGRIAGKMAPRSSKYGNQKALRSAFLTLFKSMEYDPEFPYPKTHIREDIKWLLKQTL